MHPVFSFIILRVHPWFAQTFRVLRALSTLYTDMYSDTRGCTCTQCTLAGSAPVWGYDASVTIAQNTNWTTADYSSKVTHDKVLYRHPIAQGFCSFNWNRWFFFSILIGSFIWKFTKSSLCFTSNIKGTSFLRPFVLWSWPPVWYDAE